MRIYLISRPAFIEESFAEYLSDNKLAWLQDLDATDGEKAVEVSGRICYQSFSDDTARIRFPNKKYIANLISKSHESVLEHAAWTFIIDKVSRSFTHQLVRHRVGFSFSQMSQQYKDESDVEFIQPEGLTPQHPLYAQWNSALEQIRDLYRSLLEANSEFQDLDDKEQLRARRSAARSLLPNAATTTISVTANARALRHFLKVRGTIEGDYEMRKVASRLLLIMKEEAPNLFQDMQVQTHIDGREIVVLGKPT